MNRSLLFLVVVLAHAFSTPLWALDLSGDVTADFLAVACEADPAGQNLAFPPSFPAGSASGFDVDEICLLYDEDADLLYVGVGTFNDSDGDPIPFGDADGDGDPAATGAALAAEGGTDFANLAEEEYFSLIFDFDDDPATAPEAIAGVSAERSAATGFRVSEVALPHPGVNFSFLDSYYGDPVSAAAGSTLFASPSAAAPHLEFTIRHFSALPGFSSLQLNDSDETIRFIFKAGSLGDTSIGEEDVTVSLQLSQFFDRDGDGLPNDSDLDQDNDGLPNITEQDLDLFDTDGDCELNPAEAAAAGSVNFADTESDGTADFLDTDSDDDTILDLDEADTAPFDDDGDLEIDPTELDDIDVDGNYPGGDGDGCLEGEELPDTDADGVPDYRDSDSDGDGLSDAVEAGDSDPSTPPRDSDADGIPDYREVDADDDGIPDAQEINIGTDPTNPDSDGDGVSDGDEVSAGQDPLTPGPGIDPDINLPDSDETVQIQGSGLGGCALIPMAPQTSDHPFLLLVALSLAALMVLPAVRSRRFFFIIFLLFPISAHAINVEQFRPTFDNLGLVNLYTSRTLEKRAWSVGMGFSYANQPLELGIIGTGRRLDSLIDYSVHMVLSGAYGLTDWVTLGLVVPFFPNLKLEPVGTTVGQSTAAFGDVGIAAKFHLWDRGDPEAGPIFMGFAVSPFLTFPSGENSKFAGDTNVTGGFRGIYDIEFWKNKLAVNLGFRFREQEDLFNLTVGQELLYGLGYTRPIWEPADFHGLTELTGSTTFNGFGNRENRSPLEWLVGLRKGFLESRVQATVGAGLGLTTGYGSPDFRVVGMLAYLAPPIKRREAPPSPPEPGLARVEAGRIHILRPIHFETARWTILPESLPVVQAVADLMLREPHILQVVIKGHTDHRGSDRYNLELSRRRARTVLQQLVDDGVEPERLSAEGWGERQPIADHTTEEGMAQNRRVEFHIVEVTTQ